MARWQVEYGAWVNCDLESQKAGVEIPCFRIYPEGEPERWIVQTNPALPRKVQEDFALDIAEALFNLLGV
jgi:hypothetical protein